MRPTAILLLLLPAACSPKVVSLPPEPPPPPVSLPANLRVEVYEVVDRPEKDALSYTVISVDGTSVGRTEPGLKSARKRWEGRVEPGNRLLRFERWVLPRICEWSRARQDRQPRERFVRIESGLRSVIAIKYYDEGRKYVYGVSRSPIGETSPR